MSQEFEFDLPEQPQWSGRPIRCEEILRVPVFKIHRDPSPLGGEIAGHAKSNFGVGDGQVRGVGSCQAEQRAVGADRFGGLDADAHA